MRRSFSVLRVTLLWLKDFGYKLDLHLLQCHVVEPLPRPGTGQVTRYNDGEDTGLALKKLETLDWQGTPLKLDTCQTEQ